MAQVRLCVIPCAFLCSFLHVSVIFFFFFCLCALVHVFFPLMDHEACAIAGYQRLCFSPLDAVLMLMSLIRFTSAEVKE